MISAGYLTDKVWLLRPVEGSRDKYGGKVVTWSALGVQKWAKVTFLRGARSIAQGDELWTDTVSVVMRDFAMLKEDWRVKWDSKVYRIDSMNRDRLQGSVTLRCTRVKDE